MKKVLYAEDEFTNRKLLEIQLSNHGIRCDLAEDGLIAVSMFGQDTYDLVILDQYMPGLNGNEVALKIKALNPSIPIIAITSDDSEKENLLDIGFNEVFIKPLRGKNYIEIIQSYL